MVTFSRLVGNMAGQCGVSQADVLPGGSAQSMLSMKIGKWSKFDEEENRSSSLQGFRMRSCTEYEGLWVI